MIKRYLFYILIICCCLPKIVSGQNETTYTLESCIQIALENNLTLESSKIREKTAKVNKRQSVLNMLPSVNGSYNAGVNNGRSIDPFTNDFINQRLTFSNANLSLNAVVFNGFRLLNTMKQQQLNAQAASMEVEQEKQNLVLSVTLAYLQVLNSQDVLELNKLRLVATNNQLKIQKDMYEEGRSNPADYTDLLGQKSQDETNILNSKIALNNAKLNLIQLLNLDETLDVNIESILLGMEKYQLTFNQVYKDALNNLATFKAGELRVKAAKKGVVVARTQYMPEISVFGGMNTNYSSVAQTFTETGTSIVETGDFVSINNQNVPVLREQKSFNANPIGYLDQFENNLNSVIGFSVRVPIFNGFRAKNNVALGKIRIEESLVALERTQLQIKNAIQQVHFDMEAAFYRYESLSKQVEAYEKSYQVNETRFNNGVSNFLAYITSKNNLENAKINLSIAKYDYILRTRVLEYYRGQVF